MLVTHGGIAKAITKKPFDLLIMDEASQATEPLSWIRSPGEEGGFCRRPLQLPPTIYSEEAREGLGITLFERLQKVLPGRPTLLRIQYRMHETIMGFSSQQFYEERCKPTNPFAAHDSELPGNRHAADGNR